MPWRRETYTKALTRAAGAAVDALAAALLREESLNEEQMLAVTGLAGRAPHTDPVAVNR